MMTLKIYLEGLNKFAQENPETLEMEVVTSVDDEGNGFNPVLYSPTKGHYKQREFISHKQSKNHTNAVCVN